MTVMMGRLDGPVEFLSVGQFVSGPGWRHMRRTLDSYEVIFVQHGVLPIRVGEKDMRINAKEVALLPRGIEHAGTETITTDLEFYWMHFRMPSSDSTPASDITKAASTSNASGEKATPISTDSASVPSPSAKTPADSFRFLPADASLPQDDHYLILPSLSIATDADRLTVMFTQLLDLYATYGPHQNVYCDYCATSLLLEISAQERVRRSGTAKKPGLATMQSVQSWIRANAFDDITVAKVAQRFHYSPSYLTALYRQVFDISITEQITEYRIDRARELLSTTSSSIADIAHEVGYSDPKYFMRVFKRRTGLTPNQYRKAFATRIYNTA